MKSSASIACAVVMTAVLYSCAVVANADRTTRITWPYFIFPPNYLVQDGELIGYGMQIMELLQRSLQDFDHELVQAPPKRILADLAAGRNMVVPGMLRTSEREEYMLFSTVPCRIAVTGMVALRTRDAAALAPTGVLPLGELLSTGAWRFGIIPGMRLGKLDEVVRIYSPSGCFANIIQAEGMESLYHLLASGRVDIVPLDPVAAYHSIERLGIGDAITLLPVMEAPVEFMPAHVGVPNTPFGAAVIKRVDEALREAVRSGELLTMQLQWIPPTLRDDYMAAYERLVREPVMGK